MFRDWVYVKIFHSSLTICHVFLQLSAKGWLIETINNNNSFSQHELLSQNTTDNRHLFFSIMKTRSPRGQRDALLGERPVPGLKATTFLLCPHRTGGQRVLVSSSWYKVRALDPSLGSIFRISPKPNYLSKDLPPNTITLGIRALTYKFGDWG